MTNISVFYFAPTIFDVKWFLNNFSIVLYNCIFNVPILTFKCMAFCNILDLAKVTFHEIENIARCENYTVCHVMT